MIGFAGASTPGRNHSHTLRAPPHSPSSHVQAISAEGNEPEEDEKRGGYRSSSCSASPPPPPPPPAFPHACPALAAPSLPPAPPPAPPPAVSSSPLLPHPSSRLKRSKWHAETEAEGG
eukprot:183934-Pyramimonas_sp.AAC.1